MAETISLEVQDHVAIVTLTNLTMSPAFFVELDTLFRTLNADVELRAVIVRGSGKAFSYGLDLAAAFQELGPQFQGGAASTRMELLNYIRRFQGAFNALAACPVPVIAAVHGYCIGGGVDLICACDIRLSSADAKFSVRETKMAIVADLGSLQRLPRIIGQGHTRELAFTGKDISAARAREIGLVNDVYPDAESTFAAAKDMAAEIGHNAPLTVRGTKDVLDFGEGKPITDGLAYVAAWNAAFLGSEDLGEAAAAFFEKRKPAFKGR